jgi:hypothetical protein
MKFDYGTEIIVNESAPPKYKPGNIGWVVGYREIKSIEMSNVFNQDIGCGIYTIEFEDDPDGIDIPEPYLLSHSSA